MYQMADFARTLGARDRKKRKIKSLNPLQKVGLITLGAATVGGLGAVAGRKFLFPKATKQLNSKLRSAIRADRQAIRTQSGIEDKRIFDTFVDLQTAKGVPSQEAQQRAFELMGSVSRKNRKNLETGFRNSRLRDFKQQYRDLYVKKGELGSALALGSGVSVLGASSIINRNRRNKS